MNFNTSSVTSMQNLFYGCKGLNHLNLTTFNTNQCHNFVNMFGNCNEMYVTIPNENNEELWESVPDYIHLSNEYSTNLFLAYE